MTLHTVTNHGSHPITVRTWGRGDIYIVQPGNSVTAHVRAIEHGARSASYSVEPAADGELAKELKS